MRSDRIAQLLLTPQIGGAETLAASLEAEWSRRGVTSRVFYLDDPAPSGRAQRLRKLRRSLTLYEPAVVVAHSALPNVYARIAAPSGTSVVTVLHSAGDDFESRSIRWAEVLLAPWTAAVVAVSPAQLSRYTARFPRMRRRVLVIPNGVRPGLLEKLEYPKAPRRAVAVSRFAEQKNPALWLRAAELIGEYYPGMRFDWWGPIATGEPIERVLADAHASPANIRLHGPTNDPGKALVSGDIFFHSSDREAHSVSILEAAAVGLPIVCARDVSQSLPHGLAFETFEAGEPRSAAQALRRTVANWEDAVEHATAARRRVREQYSSTKCAAEYLELFAKLSAGMPTRM